MALVNSCFCCEVPIAAGFFTVYLLIAYLIAFAFELLWILESSIHLPAAAILLCVGYFTMALFAALLVHGLATRNTLCLMAWIFSVTVLTFPEAGLVIYMSVQYWKLENLYGFTELICWFLRIIVNVVQLILVQSLYTMWKDEELVLKRLNDLHSHEIPVELDGPTTLNSQYYQNSGYAHSVDGVSATGLKRAMSTSHIWNGPSLNHNITFPMQNYLFPSECEFNASIFLPNEQHSEISVPIQKKSQSLSDLRAIDDKVAMSHYRLDSWNPIPKPIQTRGSSGTLQTYNLSLRSTRHFEQRPKLPKFASVDALDSSTIIRNQTGFYAQPIKNYGVPIYYGPLDGPDFLIYRKKMDKLASKSSLSNTSVDDIQKYRDVAL